MALPLSGAQPKIHTWRASKPPARMMPGSNQGSRLMRRPISTDCHQPRVNHSTPVMIGTAINERIAQIVSAGSGDNSGVRKYSTEKVSDDATDTTAPFVPAETRVPRP